MKDQLDEAIYQGGSQASVQEPLTRTHEHHPEIKGEIVRKDNKLLSLLKDVYVGSKDPKSSLQIKDAESQ